MEGKIVENAWDKKEKLEDSTQFPIRLTPFLKMIQTFHWSKEGNTNVHDTKSLEGVKNKDSPERDEETHPI